MKPLHRIRFFLTQYAPCLLPLAHFLLNAARLAPFKVQGVPAINSKSYAEKLRNIINTARHAPEQTSTHLLLYTGTLCSGGAERQWCYLANELASRGYRVTLLVDVITGECGHYVPLIHDNVQLMGLDTMKVSLNTALTCTAQEFPYPLCATLLAILYLRPTHVLCQLDQTNIIGTTAALLTGAQKVLMSFRSVNPSHFPYIYSEWLLPQYKELIASPRVVLTGNSRAGCDDYAQWLGIDSSRVTTIRNAVSIPEVPLPQRRQAIRQSLGIEPGKKIILGVFRWTKEKNFHLFLEIVRDLHARFPDLLVLHAGQGPYEHEVRRALKRHSLQNVVRLLGRREDVVDLMHCADLLLLTSNNEGLPNVVLEAQAAALPVVATRVGGIPEAVQDGKTALLAPRGDKETLMAHCAELLDNAALRQSMGQAGREFIQKKFSHAAMGDKMLDLIGLPRKSENPATHDLSSLAAELPIAEAIVWVGLKNYFSEHHEPVVCFSRHFSSKENSILPDGSVRVCPQQIADADKNTINFDWHIASDWTSLKNSIPHSRTAVFLDNACCEAKIRNGLNQCGFEHILFHDQGNLYLIPTVPPSLFHRLWMLARSSFRRGA